MWRRPGSHRRRPWPDVTTTKDLHRYPGNPSINNGNLSNFLNYQYADEAREPSPPDLDSPMSQSEGSRSPLVILISHSLLLLCLVTWRVCWPLAHTIVSRLPRAARVLAEELRTDISCLCRGLGRGLRSMVTGAAAAGRAIVSGADACSAIFWRLSSSL